MSYPRMASVLIALVTVTAGSGLVEAGGTTAPGAGGGMSPPPPPPPMGPTITQFTCVAESSNVWTFYGTVANPTGVTGLTINFDGLAAIDGKSVVVQSDGSFELTLTIPDCQTGEVGATLVDSNGNDYGEAATLVT